MNVLAGLLGLLIGYLATSAWQWLRDRQLRRWVAEHTPTPIANPQSPTVEELKGPR